MSELGNTARFKDKRVHILKETNGEHGRSYCGQSERGTTWRVDDDAPACGACLRLFARRVEEIGAKVDSIRIGPEGALYPS